MSSTKKKANNNEVLLPPFVPFPSSLLVPPPHLLLLLPQFLLLLIAFSAGSGEAALLQGCDFGDELCDDGELCIPDGLFGQCYSDSEAVLVRPLILDTPLSDAQSQVLRAELGRLAANGLDWPHARAQCVLAYFKLAVAFQLDYDTEFCTVRDPANIWALVQRVQNALLAEEEGEEQSGDELAEWGQGNAEGAEEEEEEGAQQPEGRPEEVQLIPVVLLGQQEEKPDGYELALAGGATALRSNRTGAAEKRRADEEPDGWEAGDQTELDEMLGQLLANRPPQVGTAGSLNDRQLARLVQFIRQLQSLLQANVVQRAAEEEMAAADLDETDMEDGEVDKRQGQQVFLLKKDMERFNNADMGLANTVHKIVKGGIQRVEGNRVYLRVTAKENLTEEELYKLIAYLDRKIAAPNRLYFDQFLYENGQLSFRVLRSPPPSERANDEKSAVHLDSASGVAQAVYKRRKDIQTLAGVRVDETGIGSGQDVVPLERSQRDQLFLPILAVCALTICALLSVLAASLISRRRHKAGGAPLLPQTIDQAGGAANKQSYEQLCRQRAADSPPQGVAIVEAGGGGGVRSKHSSSSSWPGDEPAPAAISLDIGTGHVLLAFLRKHLDQPAEMTSQWQSVCDYAAADMQTAAAMKPENADSNLDGTVLPYDESRVQLHSAEVLVELAGGEKPEGDGTYINASKIYDSDPENPAYIAAQAPLESTVARFWQMIWEQGIGLLVNLCDRQETESGVYFKYWPAEGSRTFGTFEVHLVSEHIWSEHYLVRSLYLKNTGTQETRTVTQFHFLSWAAGGVPGSNKALLEFRRKVNKSYRGRASPVLVHCSNGAGRTGTYILIDMTANRINKGVKEVNIAASLEHLRDQRMGMVENEQQFKCVFSCVADEISALLRGLQH